MKAHGDGSQPDGYYLRSCLPQHCAVILFVGSVEEIVVCRSEKGRWNGKWNDEERKERKGGRIRKGKDNKERRGKKMRKERWDVKKDYKMWRQNEVPVLVGCDAASLYDRSPTFRDNLVVPSLKSTCPMKSWTWRPVPSAPAPSQKKGGRKCTTARAVKTCKWRETWWRVVHWLWCLSFSTSVLIYVTVLLVQTSSLSLSTQTRLTR